MLRQQAPSKATPSSSLSTQPKPSSVAATAAVSTTTTTSNGKQQRRVVAASALPDVATVQDAIMGGAVLATAGAAAWAVGRGDAPVGCSLCRGTGGCSCFACQGTGSPSPSSADSSRPLTMEEVAAFREKSEGGSGPRPPKRDFFGRAPRRVGARGAGDDCRVCGGTGLVLCSQCRGSGFEKM